MKVEDNYVFVSIYSFKCNFRVHITYDGSPQVGGVIAFGIIVGSIFRELYLLNNINKSILKILSKYDSRGE